MRVLLIEAPYHDLYAQRDKVTFRRYFPLGIGYCAAMLRQGGFETDLFIQPFKADFKQALAVKLAEFQPDVVGISTMSPAYPNAVDVARQVKEWKPIPVMMGGCHATASGQEVLAESPEIDYVIYGEGEQISLDLCRHLAYKTPASLTQVPGIGWRDGTRLRQSMPAVPIAEVDTIPFPARDLVDLSFFSPHTHMSVGKKRSTTMLTGRGCPSHCIFCDAHLTMGRKNRAHSPEYVIEEMELLEKKFRMEFVVIEDDTFTVDDARVEKICRMKIQRGLKIQWNCFARSFEMRPDLARLMAEAGCRIVNFGVESGNAEVFKAVRKGGSLETIKQAVKACNDAGMRTMASFIMGHPTDTLETVRQTVEFAKEIKPTVAMFFPMVPFPGTAVWKPEYKPARIEDWRKYLTFEVPPFSLMPGFSPAEVKRMADRATTQFYMRPSQLWRMFRSISTSVELMEYLRSGYGVLSRMIR
jgi:anaerobic magnesium-protoporphyrin IX monomethyl ester cyclase